MEMRVFWWELVQNVPAVLGCGLGARARGRGAPAGGLALAAGGAVASALAISLTERRKLALESRPFSINEFALNAALFAAGASAYQAYAGRGGYRRDALAGIALGAAVGAGQWLGIDQTFGDGLRHTIALAAAAPLVFVLLRYSASAPLLKALLVLLAAALLMTGAIAAIDYYANPGFKFGNGAAA